MSHKSKGLTWYQLYLRIAKMQLGDAQKNKVQVKIGDKLIPATLDYTQSGNVAHLVLEEGNENRG